jgi:hypothetical protein
MIFIILALVKTIVNRVLRNYRNSGYAMTVGRWKVTRDNKEED